MRPNFRRPGRESYFSSSKKKFSLPNGIFYALGLLTLVGFLILFFYPELIDQIIKKFTSQPVLHKVTVDLNGKENTLPDQGVLNIQAGDKLVLVKVETSMFFNRGVKAGIEGIQPEIELGVPIEINKMVEESLNSSSDGRGKEFPINFQKDGKVFGSIRLKVIFTAADWLTWGDNQKEIKEKIRCYKFAKSLSPRDPKINLRLAQAFKDSKDIKNSIRLMKRR